MKNRDLLKCQKLKNSNSNSRSPTTTSIIMKIYSFCACNKRNEIFIKTWESYNKQI